MRVYHGTSPENAQNIKAKGFNQSEHGVYGAGVYGSTSKNVARRYAKDAQPGSTGRGADSGIVSSRIHSKHLKKIRQDERNPMDARQKSKELISSGVKAVRVKNAATGHETMIPGGGYEKEADYVISSPTVTKPIKNNATIRASAPNRKIITDREEGRADGLAWYLNHEHPGMLHDTRPYRRTSRKR